MSNFVTEPEVVLVGKPIMEIDGVMKFLNEHGYSWPELESKLESMIALGDDDGEWIIEIGGRMCYQSWPKRDEKAKGRNHDDHVKHLIEIGHGSCLEHATLNFAIWNISRSCSHELVRHRISSFSQLSQRYVDSSNVSFIVPQAMQELKKTDPDTYRTWIEHCERSRQLYEELTTKLSDMYQDIESNLERRKKARQAARSVLPNAAETKILVTMNGRAVRHFIEMRASAPADLEIRKLAMKIFRIMEAKFPLIVHGMEVINLPDGTQAIESKYRRT